jgi:hypothetical protein
VFIYDVGLGNMTVTGFKHSVDNVVQLSGILIHQMASDTWPPGFDGINKIQHWAGGGSVNIGMLAQHAGQHRAAASGQTRYHEHTFIHMPGWC